MVLHMKVLKLAAVLGLAWLTGCAGPASYAPSAPSRIAAPAAAANDVAQVLTGSLQGAPWRIDVPAGWNGDLVMLLHGYEPVGSPRSEPVEQDPTAPVFLQLGYAVAYSAYRAQGWAVAEAMQDIEALRQHFIHAVGPPAKTFVAGFSMGGMLALATLEAHPDHYDGALSLCGVNAPAEEIFADGVLLPLLAIEVYFPGVLGMAGGDPLAADGPPMIDPAGVAAAFAAAPERTAQLAQRLQIRPEELPGALWLHYVVLRELAQRAGGVPVDNQGIRYSGFGDDADFNARVRRVRGDPTALAYARAHAALQGQPVHPVVLQSNVIDPTVPPRFARRYLELAAGQGRADLVHDLPPRGEGHCRFALQEVDAAFVALVERVQTAR